MFPQDLPRPSRLKDNHLVICNAIQSPKFTLPGSGDQSMDISSEVHCLTIGITNLSRPRFFQEALVSNFSRGSLPLMPQLHFALGKVPFMLPLMPYIRADTMSAHILQVLFAYGLQKLREIIRLKLGRKATLNFPVVIFLEFFSLHSELVFTESRTFCSK